jgi:hypothetical protein
MQSGTWHHKASAPQRRCADDGGTDMHVLLVSRARSSSMPTPTHCAFPGPIHSPPTSLPALLLIRAPSRSLPTLCPGHLQTV